MRLGLEAGKLTLDLAVELGVTGVPISGAALAGQGVDAALAPLRQRGLSVCQIGAFGYNPLAPDADAVRRETESLRTMIVLAPQTGCRYIVISPGNYHASTFGHYDPRNFTDAALDAMADALRPLLQLAEEHDVCLSVEPYLKAVIHGPEAFLGLHGRVPSPALRANVDPSSLYSFHDAIAPAAMVERVCTGLAGHYGLIHVKEVNVSEGFHIHMGLCPLGAGHTDWMQLLKLASPHLPADSWLVLEHVADAEEARRSVAMLRQAAKKLDLLLE